MIRIKTFDPYSRFTLKGLIMFLSLFPAISTAQYSTNSLYSMYGLGDLNKSRTGKISGMGYAGVALRSVTYLNNLNPASYSSFDSTSFIFDFGLSGYSSFFSSQGTKKFASDVNFNHLAIGFPFTKWWGASFGIVPYSTVGYNITSSIPVEGKILDVETQFTGNGGINQFYFSNSFSIARQLSLGFNLSYFMGYITQNELTRISTLGLDNVYTIRTRHFNNLHYSFGFQYELKINNDRLSIGATYSPLQKLRTDYNIVVRIEDGDILKNETDVLDDFIMPSSLSAGLAYEINSTLCFALDYSLYKWSDAGYVKYVARLTDCYSINFGMEYNPVQKKNATFWNVIKWRMGGYYEKTYLLLKGNEILDKGITLGTGFPIKRQKSTINISVGLGQLGTLKDGLMKESYGFFNLSLSLHDYWFFRRKFE